MVRCKRLGSLKSSFDAPPPPSGARSAFSWRRSGFTLMTARWQTVFGFLPEFPSGLTSGPPVTWWLDPFLTDMAGNILFLNYKCKGPEGGSMPSHVPQQVRGQSQVSRSKCKKRTQPQQFGAECAGFSASLLLTLLDIPMPTLGHNF